MIRSLSGRTHQVYTGVTLTTKSEQRSFVSRSDVTFATLTEEEIRHYVTHFRPMDKAGAYGLQEWIGYTGIGKIEGSYFTIMGLPVHLVYQELVKFIG